jgi:GNAT superfamily N-acetyltransferase
MSVAIRRLEESDETASFDCGDVPLNNYLKKHAWVNQEKSSIGVTYVAVDDAALGAVLGYFTIAMSSVPREGFPKKYVRGLPNYDLPLILLARLAVDLRFAGKGIGHALISEAFRISLRIAGEWMPLHHYRCLSPPDELVCTIRICTLRGLSTRRAAENVPRYSNHSKCGATWLTGRVRQQATRSTHRDPQGGGRVESLANALAWYIEGRKGESIRSDHFSFCLQFHPYPVFLFRFSASCARTTRVSTL